VDLILDPPGYVKSGRLFDVLLAAPESKAIDMKEILLGCRTSPRSLIGRLG